jgi:hypothetical protein
MYSQTFNVAFVIGLDHDWTSARRICLTCMLPPIWRHGRLGRGWPLRSGELLAVSVVACLRLRRLCFWLSYLWFKRVAAAGFLHPSSSGNGSLGQWETQTEHKRPPGPRGPLGPPPLPHNCSAN